MPDNGQSPENEFDRRLEDLGDHIEYPPTPDLAASVREGLQGEDRQRPSLAGWVAVAVVVLISLPVLAGIVFSGGLGGGAGGGGVVSGDSGSGGAAMESADAPTETTSDSSAMMEETSAGSASSGGAMTEDEAQGVSGGSVGSKASPGAGFGFGEGISLREARKLSNPPLLLPTSSGYERPDEVYVGRPPNQDGFVLVYAPRGSSPRLGESDAGAILTELDDGAEAYIKDTSAASIEAVVVGDSPGYWSLNGIGTTSSLGTAERLPGNVLVWERDGRALRLQADIPRDEAIQIAESVR